MTKQQKFIASYLKQFETILSYVRATRERNFLLHLETTEELIKYFFAHDHLNYARLLPLYLSCMQNAKLDHPEIWLEFMKGNFCVSKSLTPFTSIAPDHALEQENRSLKVKGGIVGITQNTNVLKRFFLIAPELKRLVGNFQSSFGINKTTSRKEHREIRSCKLERVMKNKKKLLDIIVHHGDPFSNLSLDLSNIITNAVLPEGISEEILNRDQIGQQIFLQFVNERFVLASLSIWDPIKRRKISTFMKSNVTIELHSGDKVVKLKEERGLLQRFVIAARSRADLDLKECIGAYEFGLIPRPLFSADGSLIA